MSNWIAEILRAWRASLRGPGFLLLATGVLALGVGASAGAFTLVANVLLKPLPFANAQQLVMLAPSYGADNSGFVSPRQFRQMQPLAGVRAMGLIMNSPQLVAAGTADKPVLARQTWISAGLLRTLDLRVAVGRGFDEQEFAAHGPRVVLLSRAFWMRGYGGDPRVVGQTVKVQGETFTVAGVLPSAFGSLGKADIVRPIPSDSMLDNRDGAYDAVVRLDGTHKPAEIAAQATARLQAALPSDAHQSVRRSFSSVQIAAFDARSVTENGSAATPIIVLLQVCGVLVLVVALVNLINLMVMRASASAHSQSVRKALGASGLRLALSVLSEGLLVGLLGSLIGVALGQLGIDLLKRLGPLSMLAPADLHAGWRVWLLAVGVGVATSLLAAWLGQRHAQRVDAMAELREGSRSGAGARAGRLGRALVVVQVVLATMGLMAAAMVTHAVVEASAGPAGFDDNGVLVFDTMPVPMQQLAAGSVDSTAARLRTDLRAIPGVEAVTIATHLPLQPTTVMSTIPTRDGNTVLIHTQGADSGFFRTFKIPLLAGRTFTAGDLSGSAKIAIVNRHLASTVFDGHAIGQFIGSGANASRIVGVVGDAGLADRHPSNQVYVPRTQTPQWVTQGSPWFVALRVRGAPNAYRDAVRNVVAAVAPQWPVANHRSMREAVREATRAARTNLLLVGMLAALTLLLAVAGQYAVMMSSVAASEREFGIRAALGASPSRLVRWTVGIGMRRMTLGLAIGVALGVVACLLMRSGFVMLGRSPIDPWAIGATCVALTLAGFSACLLPALRAGRVQPMTVLRED